MKLITIVGTRPELIKLSRVIAELDRCVEHILVHTGQNHDYELNGIFFREMGIRDPDHHLNAVGSTAAETIGKVIAATDALLEKIVPDALLILGDTNSCLSTIAAKRRKIPIFHMEAGNRCFDLRVPEEINRKIVDHISDINLVYTEHARRYLLAEGIRPETIIKTGSPMMEVLAYHEKGIDGSDVLQRLELQKGRYFLVSAHREENVNNESNFGELLKTFSTMARHFDRPVIVSTHPRTRKQLELQSEGEADARVRFLKPLGFYDYVHLEKNAACVLSDSGTLTEESSILNFPAVAIREMHERPEGMDEGTLIMCGLRASNVIRAVEIVMEQALREISNKRFPAVVEDYDISNVSRKVVRLILSYTDYVNRTVWKK